MNSKSRLFIIGAGGFGRELETYLGMIKEDEREWELCGYLDDNEEALNNYPSNLKVLGNVAEFNFEPNDQVVLAIAHPETKKQIYAKLKSKVKFFTYIDKSALVGEFVEIGEGSIICPNCIVTTNIKLGNCTILNIGTQIGHDVILKDYCSLMPNVDIGGCSIINEKVFIGTNSTIIPSKVISENTVIGAGAIVVKDIEVSGTYVGNPAKRLS